MANKLIIEVNAAKPEETKRPLPWAWLLAATGVLILSAAAGGYAWFRAGRTLATPEVRGALAQTDTAPAAGWTDAAVAAVPVPTNPPAAADAPLLPAGTFPSVVAESESPCPGAVRVTVSAPEYAAAFLAGTGKRLRLDTNGWESVPSFPHVLVPVPAGSSRIRLEADGFDCASLQGSNEVDVLVESGVTNEAAFTLTPRLATLTIVCDVTNATVRVGDRESGVGSPITVSSLKPLALAVSASGHRVQNLNLDALAPGAAERREVRLERESGTVRVAVTVPTNAVTYLAGAAKRIRIGNGGWAAVEALPQELTNLVCGVTEVMLEAEGFGTATQRVTVADGQTVGAAFALTPQPATLTVACNLTNATVRIGSRESGVGRPTQVPSLAPLEIQVSAAGYVAQTLKFTGIKPGGTFRQEVTLEPESKAATVQEKRPEVQETLTKGQTRTVADLSMTFMPIAAGEFMMGSEKGDDDEKPVHRVRIPQSFWIGKTEVTQKQWRSLMGDNPSLFKGDDNPVERVDWNKSLAFCKKMTEREKAAGRLPSGYVYRLPTEAEWEYAARDGESGTSDGNSSSDDMSWSIANSGGQTHPVGQKRASKVGLHDMSGNVWEWCLDEYHESYTAAPADGACWGNCEKGGQRVRRGGCWTDDPSTCSAANRNNDYAFIANQLIGFRVVLAPSP